MNQSIKNCPTVSWLKVQSFPRTEDRNKINESAKITANCNPEVFDRQLVFSRDSATFLYRKSRMNSMTWSKHLRVLCDKL